jgi:surface antigen
MFGYAIAHGQEYGELLDGSEQLAMSETLQYALENTRTNEAAAWVNPDTGRSGTLTPVRTFQNSEGQYCREYVTTIIIGGEEQQGYGMACRQPDGSWLIVSDEPGETTADYKTIVENNYIYPYGYADWYYRYPYYAWDYYYPSIFFSFDIVHFSKHRHSHGHHFHGTKHFHGTRHFDGRKQFHGTKQFGDNRAFHGTKQFRDNRQFHGTKQFRDNQVFRGERPHVGGQHFKGGHRFDNHRQSSGGNRGGRGR